MFLSTKARVCGLFFTCFVSSIYILRGIYILRNQVDPVNTYSTFNFYSTESEILNYTCGHKILDTKKYLEAENLTFHCEALEAESCEETHQR